MAEPNILFHWQTYSKTICESISLMQQRDEFVDMTLAADGYHVKVHKMIISLASPYLKELIMSTDNPHPIIFLHKISYTTLTYILEFVYSGQVMVKNKDTKNFVHACRSLQIKGLETKVLPMDSENLISINPEKHIVNPKASKVKENNNNVTTDPGPNQIIPTAAETTTSVPTFPEFKNPFPTTVEATTPIPSILEFNELFSNFIEPPKLIPSDFESKDSFLNVAELTKPIHTGFEANDLFLNVAEPTKPIPTDFQSKNPIATDAEIEISIPTDLESIQPIPTVETMDLTSLVGGGTEQPRKADDENFLDTLAMDITTQEIEDDIPAPQCSARKPPVQYSVSSRGSVQMVVNGFIYRLKYSGMYGQRTWQCVHAYGRNTRCKAQIHTNKTLIVGRTGPHNHQSHCKEVIKKIEMGIMFNTLEEAQRYLKDGKE